MKTQGTDSLPVNASGSLSGDRPPTLIFRSRGSGKRNQTKTGTHSSNGVKDDIRWRSSFESMATPLKIATSGSREQSTVLNGSLDTSLASKAKSGDIPSILPSNSETELSPQRHNHPLPTLPDLNAASQTRKSLSFSRTSSLSLATSSLTRRYSFDVNPPGMTKPPPLIPAPKAFLHRHSSLSSSKRKQGFSVPASQHYLASSSSTNGKQNVLSDPLQPPQPQLPLPAPSLPVNYNNTEVRDTNVLDSQRQLPSFLGPGHPTHTNQHSQTSPVVTSASTPTSPSLPSSPPSMDISPSSIPPPHFRFPSPPHSPPPPSPTPLEEPTPPNTSTPTSVLSPHSDYDTDRKRSVSPSEAMGYLDEAIADHTCSTGSYGDSIDHPDFSPVFHFNTIPDEHLPETFTSNSPSAVDPEDCIKETEAREFVTQSANVTSQQHPGLTTPPNLKEVTSSSSKNIRSLEEMASPQKVVGNTSHHLRNDVSDSSPDHVRIDEPKLPAACKVEKKRKPSLSPRKVEILKLQPDIKTVRQQIKPGIVGELATLFKNMGDEYDSLSPSGESRIATEHSVRNHESGDKNQTQSLQKAGRNCFNTPSTEVFSPKEYTDIDVIITSRIQPQSPDNDEQIQLKPSLDSKSSPDSQSSLDTASKENAGIKPGSDYLSASKEMFKRMVDNRSEGEADNLKKDIYVDREETLPFSTEDSIVFPPVLATSTPNKSEHRSKPDTQNSNKHSNRNSIRTEPKEIDMEVNGNPTVLNSLTGKNATALTNSTNSDNQESLHEVGLNIVKASTGAAQEPEYAMRVDGPVYISNEDISFNQDNMEMLDAHTHYAARSYEPLSAVVKETSVDHDEPKYEPRTNIQQHDEVCVTRSQFSAAESGVSDSKDDELNPVIDNCERNASVVINPQSPRLLSHVITSKPLLTIASTENKNSFTNINKEQPFTCVKNYNTPAGETPVAKTGSENDIRTNTGSLRSNFSLSTQTVSKSQPNNDYRDFRSEDITSYTSEENSMIGTTLDRTSNDGACMIDGRSSVDFSPLSRDDYDYLSDDKNAVKHSATDTSVYSTKLKKDYNAGVEVSHRGYETPDKTTKEKSLTLDVTPTGGRVEDYSHKQTVDVSFCPPDSSHHTILTESVEDGFNNTDGVDLTSQGFTDQVSDGDVFTKFSQSDIKSQKSFRNPDVAGMTGIEPLNTDSSVQKQSDDFLSILEDITIQTDITSGFLGSSKRSGNYSKDKQHENSAHGSYLVDEHKDQVQEHSNEQVMRAGGDGIFNESIATDGSLHRPSDEPSTEKTEKEDIEFDHSLPASTEITTVASFLSMPDRADLNEEIKKQHGVLSPRLSTPPEYEKVLNREHDNTRSHRSSVSSTTGSQKGPHSGMNKETLFNSDFFSKSVASHQTSSDRDSVKEATSNSQSEHEQKSHADIFDNAPNSDQTCDNVNEHENLSKSEWITPTDISKLIDWSQYEARSQIQLASVSGDSKKEQGDSISYRSSTSSNYVDEKKEKKTKGTVVNGDVFSKQEVTSNTAERRLSRQESLIKAAKVIRSIPWSEYENKLKVDSEPVEFVEFVKSNNSEFVKSNNSEVVKSNNSDVVKSNNSNVEHSHHHSLQQELNTAINSRLTTSHGLSDSVDGTFTNTGKEIYDEKHKLYDTEYSNDTHESHFNFRNSGDTGQTNDSNNNTVSSSSVPTRESSSVRQFISQVSHDASNKEEETTKRKQDEISLSKNKFQALKNVFEKQDSENHPTPIASVLTKRGSFKLDTKRSPPTGAVSRAKNGKNGEMSIAAGGNVRSQHETGVSVSRDADHRGVDVHVWRDKGTEIDAPERRDSECTDTSNEIIDGSDVDTRGTRATNKKSQQTNLAYDVHTDELLRHSFSRNSSVRSSSSSHSVKTDERLSSHIKSESERWSTDTNGFVKPETDWTTTVHNNGLDNNVDLPSVSDTPSVTHSLRENGSLEIPTGISEITSPAESDKQTELIDAYLRSSIGSTRTSHAGVDNITVRSHSRKGSFGQAEDNHIDRDREHGSNSFGQDSESVKVKTDYFPEATVGHSEPDSFNSATDERKHSDSMTAVVGEVSRFSIHKKITTREESFGVQSESSVIADSPRDNKPTDHGQSGKPDMFFIPDKNGDYYALQEVENEDDGRSVVRDNVNLHIVESSRTDGHYRATTEHGFHDTSATNHDHYPHDGDITDVYIDSSAVDDDKARELISAYLDSQELNRQHNATANGVQTYQGSSATKQHYSHKNYTQDVTQGGVSVADENMAKLYTITNSGAPGTSEFVSSSNNGTIVVQQSGFSGVTGNVSHPDEYAGSRSYISSSTYQHDGIGNSFADNTYTSSNGRFEQLNAGAGDEDNFTSSYNMTRVSMPRVAGSPSPVVDTAYSTRRSGDYSTYQPSDYHRVSDSTHLLLNQSGVNPFQPTPLTITTTTQAVVGKQVGMRIDYPPNGAPDVFVSSSDEEINQKRYIVKNVQQKSSLKKTSKYDPRSFSDSNSDNVFTPGGITTTQFNTIGTTRDILQSHDFDNRLTRSINGSDSSSVADEPAYRVYQSQNVNHSLPRSANDYNRSYRQENAFSSSREDENNLYKVRNLSTSVSDGLQYAGDQHRGRSDKKSRNYADTKKTYRQQHSPERVFKNAKLSLRKDDYDNDYYSDEDNGDAQYRTVTKVYLNEDKPRSRSQSPDTRYQVSSVQSQISYEKKQDLDETDSGYQEQHRRYIVVGTSDNSEDRQRVNAHSSPRLDRKHSKSFEEATITRTELVQPSRLNNEPPSTKTHKTVIQLDVGDNKAKERRSSDDIDSSYMIKRAKSVDDLHRESRSTLTVNNGDGSAWRTGQLRGRSNSDDEEVDRQEASLYATTPRMVKTLKQEDGDKLYVINSTVPRELNEALNHSDGWYTSTIDINQNRPDKVQSVDHLLSHRINEDNYKAEKTVYFVRETAPQTNSSRSYQRNHSTEFAYPDSGTGTEVASSDGENEVRQKFERVERIYEVRSQPNLPEHFQSMEDLSNDLRVLRGNILIKNRLSDTEHGDDDFDENVNLFDNSFHLGKDNPLFTSDPDILASLRREEEQALASHVHQDITFETVDKIAHEYREEKQVQTKQAPVRKKQNLSQLLLSKLASVDSKDIRQTIDVEHHNEEIYGDIDFIHADGERKTSSNTRNFDSVNEKVELTLTQGKAYVIIKVIAERIVPTDYEFNVWRKSQAIVTRQIEIDLLANEQRRRLYKHVMASAGTAGSLEDGSRSHYYDSEVLSPQERQLSSMETLKLFSQILDVTEGQGDKDYTDTHTRQEMGQLPAAASGMDLLY